jgi:diguanylate cyclase (GGDEF)-like protein/PAS domain S-box-containing protein
MTARRSGREAAWVGRSPSGDRTIDDAEQRYRTLIARAPVGQAIYDTSGVVVEVNKAWADLVGYDTDAVIGQPAADFVHPEDRAEIIELGRRLVSGEIGSLDRERRLVRRDGSTVWVTSSITLELDEHGVPRHFHSTVLDVTERKRAEQALRASERRYRRLVNEAPVGHVLARLDGTLVEVNEAFIELTGSTRRELFAREPRELFHPDDLKGMARELERLVRGETESFETERRLIRADGGVVFVAGRTTLVEEGQEPLLQSILYDITERRRAEEALRASERRYRDVVETLHDGVLVHDHRHLEGANRAALDLLGRTLSELSDPATWASMDPIDESGHPIAPERHAFRTALREERPVRDHVTGIQVPGIGRRWLRVNARPRFDAGRLVGNVVTLSDITERKLAEDALRESETRFRTLAESLPVGVFHTDLKGGLLYVNPKWSEITGRSGATVLETNAIDLVHPEDRDRIIDAYADSLMRGQAYHDQYRIVTHAGETRWVSSHGGPTYDVEGRELRGFIGSIEDITPLVSAREELTRLAGIVESTSDLVGVVDLETEQVAYLNPAGRRIFGFPRDRPLEITSSDLYEPTAFEMWESTIRPALDRGETWSGELAMRRVDGTVVQVWQTVAGSYRADGSLAHVSAVGRDVTERRRLEAELAHQATHDALTDLPNRALLLDHLELALVRAERDRKLVALLFLDLDRFKQVNDSFGHDTGDQLLIWIADRIVEALRPADTVARLGGDEFVVLCEDVDDEHHAVAIAQRVVAAIESAPFVIRGLDLPMTASVGIALSPGEDQAHPEALLRDADAAMYRAKDQGRARLELFDESMRQRAAQRLALADELSRSIGGGTENGDIAVHFQPCVHLETGRVISVEALARWEHPERGLLPPSEFISLAEETGLIVDLGLRVLAEACSQARSWYDTLGVGAPRVHVNLSARQLISADLPLLVQQVLRDTRLPADRLCLEITESVLMDDAATVMETLRGLKEIGLSLAIDDFGTGYSSLSYLRRFPVDVLKVDRTFVDGLGPDPEDSAIVAAIVSLASTLELETVAEGVETPEQLDRLRALGCTAAQGFLFSRPVPAPALTGLLPGSFI